MPREFPHMYGNEAEIWRRWLKYNKRKYKKFDYDVHVGKPWPEHLTLEPPWRKGADAVYLKRIDVVGYTNDSITIFEVKPHAGLGAIGQIIGYLALYEEQFAPAEELKGAIVTQLVDPNVSRILNDHGIDLFVVGR